MLPDEILGVICRGLAVNSQTMEKNVSPDLVMVGAMLPQIHIALLKVLDCLIMWSVFLKNFDNGSVKRLIFEGLFFYVLLTMHLSITLANDQLDAHIFLIHLLQSSTCFKKYLAHPQEVKLF